MRKIISAILLAGCAVPAQAIDYVLYEAWGSATGAWSGYVDGEQVLGAYTGTSHATALFAMDELGCSFGQYRCSTGPLSITFANQDWGNYFSFTLNFSEISDRYPLDVSTFIGGTVDSRAGYHPNFFGYGFMDWGRGQLTDLRITVFSADERIPQAAGAGFRIAAVPEPTTWALMIGGFAMVGGALRRRRVSEVFA